MTQATLEERCSSCGRPLVWAGGRLICPGACCPGDQDLAATTRCRPQGAQPAADELPSRGGPERLFFRACIDAHPRPSVGGTVFGSTPAQKFGAEPRRAER